MCMINWSKAGHSLQDFRLSRRYCLNIQFFSFVTLFQSVEELCHDTKQLYIPSIDSVRIYSYRFKRRWKGECLKLILQEYGPGLYPMASFFLQELFKLVFAK
jgi:hypothetical protein